MANWGYSRRRRGRRSGSGFGGAVNDTVSIAARLGPRGVLITGATGFVVFYFIVPWLLVLWADHSKAKMSNGASGTAMKHFLDELIYMRFIHPAEWAGIAILIGCLLLACWKVVTQTDLSYADQREMTWLSKLMARFFD